MDFPDLRRKIIVCLFIVLALSACQNPSPPPATLLPVTEVHETPDSGQSYTSTKYNFRIEYPPGWQVRELSVLPGSTPQEEVWFSAGEFPPANTGARPDLTLVITEQDPFARWRQEHFDEYRSEIIQIADGTAVRITGVNKESLQEETVVIIKLNDVYLEMLPGQSAQALEAFDKILDTFSSPELQPAEIPAELVPAETAVPENTACIGPYFDSTTLLLNNERLLLRWDMGSWDSI